MTRGLLVPGDVHVWLIDLDLPPAQAAAAEALLAADELARAARFRFTEGRRRFVTARGQLRQILGAYTQTEPARIGLAYSTQGKPRLAEPARTLGFNLAHSHELGAVALAEGTLIGIDVEYQPRRVDLRLIAERFFAPAEAAQLASLPAAEQTAAFQRCWTRKEAILKARGDGLALPLDRFEVSLLPGEPARVVRVAPELADPPWTLLDVAAPADYVAAVAVAAPAPRLIERGFWRPDGP